ncbi:MAG TPA: ATP-binding protein, partial [Candidatus Sulfotelmatobacter sp.]|nr:ATP-binding protein [Candidatus Sulfotelmatobacter sp.]
AAKHGKAKTVRLSLERLRERSVLTVQDDGVGFSLAGTQSAGMGLRIMHYRARVIGASLEVRSQPGAGTLVTCRFGPLLRDSSRQLPVEATTPAIPPN